MTVWHMTAHLVVMQNRPLHSNKMRKHVMPSVAHLYSKDRELPSRERGHKGCQTLRSLKAYQNERTPASGTAEDTMHVGRTVLLPSTAVRKLRWPGTLAQMMSAFRTSVSLCGMPAKPPLANAMLSSHNTVRWNRPSFTTELLGAHPTSMPTAQSIRPLAMVAPNLSSATPPARVPKTPVRTVTAPKMRSAVSPLIENTSRPALGPR